MPAIYFPDVPEYQPLIRVLRSREGCRSEQAGGYICVRSDTELAIQRSETGLFEAVWFGALVGGFEGKIVRFDDQELRLG